ncbi:stalled ribosome rescue protein Dom34 [Bradyrhizobium sp. LM6.10]
MSKKTTQVHSHAVVWIDQLIAKVFSIGSTGVSAMAVRAHLAPQGRDCQTNTGSADVKDDPTFVVRVGWALSSCTDLLIIGPGTEKTELMNFLRVNRPDLTLHVETSNPPTDREIVALGRKIFRLD